MTLRQLFGILKIPGTICAGDFFFKKFYNFYVFIKPFCFSFLFIDKSKENLCKPKTEKTKNI